MLDNLAIPKEASHVEEAYAFIDFLLRPDIAARNTNFTHMANGVLASKNLIDKSISDNKSIYPDTAVMQRLFVPKEHDLATQNAIILAPSRTQTGRQTR
jgi:putrescine transport system substrate-binding protein